MTEITISHVNLYRSHGAWCYAAWSGAEHDHNDVLSDAATEAEARAEIVALFGAGVTITRVARVEG